MESWITASSTISENSSSSYKWYEQIPKIYANSRGTPVWLPLMAVGVTVDMVKNREKYSLGIDQPSFYPATQNMLHYGNKYPTVQIYQKYAIDTAIFLGANKTIAQQDMKDVIEFEIMLAKASAKETARNASLVNSTTVGELPDFPCGKHCHENVQETPSWQNYFNNIFESAGISETKINLNDSVIHLNPQYFDTLVNVLNETNPR